ncbi:MAG TPA: type II secretion system minor pseudopilin GspI [Woeseiaceae bacterium]|nr:type II secretion system minor pseudopilin GspI [Woeseiaceae bacterium]
MTSPRCDAQKGFTLIEVMVSLAIAALALGAVAASISQMFESATAMELRTYASWIAQNRIAELRLANVVPEVSEDSDQVEFADQEWTWRSTVSETGVENLFRVDVEVSLAGSDDVIRTVTGFVGEPGIPGQSNLAWAGGTFAPGAGPGPGEEPADEPGAEQ